MWRYAWWSFTYDYYDDFTYDYYDDFTYDYYDYYDDFTYDYYDDFTYDNLTNLSNYNTIALGLSVNYHNSLFHNNSNWRAITISRDHR